MISKKLLSVEVVTDDDTGIYKIGELDFGKPVSTDDWLKKNDNRDRFVRFLRWLADRAEKGETPFRRK